jgi:hypothetical protein
MLGTMRPRPGGPRYLLGAKDLVDARYRKPLDLLAFAPAVVSPVHFSPEFRRAFGETPVTCQTRCAPQEPGEM